MSSREPLWFCHQCNAEMRPLMMPDPVCASCRGTFVEKMDDTTDDPRAFQHGGPMLDDFPSVDPFLMALQGILDHRRDSQPSSPRSSPPAQLPRFTFEMRRSPSTGSPRFISLGGGNTLGGRPGDNRRDRVPTMNEFLRDGDDAGPGGGIAGPLMAQYLLALLGHRDPFADMLRNSGGSGGRMGDYVFNQEALDQIITQLMENSNSHRPVPATEEIMDKLPREVLEEGSPMLDKDCAVCKEQFATNTENPDEQVVVTLPCKHPFHEPCIMPWLKSSGTCPVCRHALIAQPNHDPPQEGGSGTNSRPGSPPNSRSQRPGSPRDRSQDSGGLLHSVLSYLGGNGNSTSGSRTGHSPRQNSRSSRSRERSDENVPGRWDD